MQSQRFALQELLKQFLLVYHHCTSSFLFHKKVQSQRFALQELLKQFLEVFRYCMSNFLFHKKVFLYLMSSIKYRKTSTLHHAFNYYFSNAFNCSCTLAIMLSYFASFSFSSAIFASGALLMNFSLFNIP